MFRPRLLYVPAIALAVAIPYERLEPALTLPGQKLTNLELVLLVALGCWMLALARGRVGSASATPITWPVLLLVAVMLASALLATDHRANSIKFIGRFVVGFAAFMLFVHVAGSSRRIVGLIAATVTSAVVVSVLAILEWRELPAVLDWLVQFRPGTAVVGGHVRATSTLQYPTITSMYLEIAFGLGVGLLLVAVPGRRWLAALITAALTIIAVGIVLTFTRAGLLVLVAMLAASIAMWCARRGFDGPAVALALLSTLVLGVISASFSGGLQWLRLTTEQQQGWYRAGYIVPEDLSLRTSETRLVEVRVRNEGRLAWTSDERVPFRLSYHWLDRDGRVLEFDGIRTAFERDVPPGEEVSVRARVRAPARPGEYRLAWDVVQEQRLWFSTEHSSPALTTVVVGGEPLGPLEPTPAERIPTPGVRLSRLALWRIAGLMLIDRPLRGVGPDNFRLEYGRYAGLEHPDLRVHSNNLYLEFFAGAGLIGGAVFLWLTWRLVRVATASWLRASPAELPLAVGTSCGVLAILLHGTVDSFFEFTPTYLMIWLAFALLVSVARRVPEPSNPAHPCE